MMARHFRIRRFVPLLLWTMILLCMVNSQAAATESFQPIIPDGERIEDVEPLLSHISRGSPIYSVAFSPDGKTLVSGSWDNTVRLWDTASGKQKGIFIGGRRGTWLTSLFDESSPGSPSEKEWICRRYDDGTLLVKK